MTGSTIPFAATSTQREASGDPRAALEERYPSRDNYLEQVRRAAQALVNTGYLLTEDLDRIVQGAGLRYDHVQSNGNVVQAADD